MAAIFGVFRCQKNNLPFKVIRRFSTFAEFLVERENESLKIDLALDSSYRFEPLLELAAQKDPGFDNYWFALALNHCENFPDEMERWPVKMLQPFDPPKLKRTLLDWAIKLLDETMKE